MRETKTTVLEPVADFRTLKDGPQPALPPENLRSGIGVGDFWLRGWESVEGIATACDLGLCTSVVELGCGLGRIAHPLSHVLPPHATYRGFDVAAAYIEWCQEVLPLRRGFEFEHLDVVNSLYNPSGRRAAHRATIPVEDGGTDLVIATSLLTHLVPREINRYLKETSRILRSGGCFFCTVFLADEQSLPLILAKATDPCFQKQVRHGFLANAASPGDAVAVDTTWFHSRAERHGFSVDEMRAGGWRGTDAYYQDIVVMRKR